MAQEAERVEEETTYDELMFLSDLYLVVCHTGTFPMMEEGETHEDCPNQIAKNEFIVYPTCGEAIRVSVEPVSVAEPSPRLRSQKMMKVNLVMIMDDNGWALLTAEVPAALGRNRERVIRWVEYNLAGQVRYRNVIAWQIHSYPKVEDDGDT